VGRKTEYHIRHAVPDDYAGVTELFEGPKAVWGTLQIPFPAREVWRKRLAEPEAGLVLLVACEGTRDEVVGMLGIHTNPSLHRRRHAAGIGMVVRDNRQGRGVGTALLKAALELADGWMNLTRLELQVWVDNEAAVRLYQKFGFEVEGTLRQYALREGRLIDALAMSRVRPPPQGGTAA
jgi:putative acetyltransferase